MTDILSKNIGEGIEDILATKGGERLYLGLVDSTDARFSPCCRRDY